MSKDDILLEAEMAMEKSVDYMVHEFSAVRTGKASPGLVEMSMWPRMDRP